MQIIHYCITMLTTLSTIVLGYFQYKGAKVTKEIDSSQHMQDKISELEINQAVISERLNNQIEAANKIDEKIDLIIAKGKRNE